MLSLSSHPPAPSSRWCRCWLHHSGSRTPSQTQCLRMIKCNIYKQIAKCYLSDNSSLSLCQNTSEDHLKIVDKKKPNARCFLPESPEQTSFMRPPSGILVPNILWCCSLLELTLRSTYFSILDWPVAVVASCLGWCRPQPAARASIPANSWSWAGRQMGFTENIQCHCSTLGPAGDKTWATRGLCPHHYLLSWGMAGWGLQP